MVFVTFPGRELQPPDAHPLRSRDQLGQERHQQGSLEGSRQEEQGSVVHQEQDGRDIQEREAALVLQQT